MFSDVYIPYNDAVGPDAGSLAHADRLSESIYPLVADGYADLSVFMIRICNIYIGSDPDVFFQYDGMDGGKLHMTVQAAVIGDGYFGQRPVVGIDDVKPVSLLHYNTVSDGNGLRGREDAVFGNPVIHSPSMKGGSVSRRFFIHQYPSFLVKKPDLILPIIAYAKKLSDLSET